MGIVLAKGEDLVRSDEFLTSHIFLWLKLRLAVTTRRIAGEKPNTILGVIPLGSLKLTYPLPNVASVGTYTKLSVGALLLGVVLLVAAYFLVSGASGDARVAGFVVAVLGLLSLIEAYQAHLGIWNTGGNYIGHRISIFDRGAADAFCQELNTIIASRS
jgi:hypothetical protein